MRSLADARVSWKDFKSHRNLQDLREAVRLDGRSSLATAGSRSACWKAFLLLDTLDTSSWPASLASARSAYSSLCMHFLRLIDNPQEFDAGYDPLSDDGDSSPWIQAQKDEELRAEILQDVERCMPDILYFRQPETQRTLLSILFVYCKLNPDVSYRQGMHELAAPILWVVERDAIDLGRSSKVLGEDAVIRAVFDAEYIEHDAFALFAQVMQNAKSFYEQTTHSGQENPMVSRSRRIAFEHLSLVDAELATHLEAIEIVPQVFLMRWIRLLFGREFPFDGVLGMWDALLAEDPSLDLVDHICVAMLLRIRWDLVEAGNNEALGLLLRYPEAERDFVPQSLVLDAVYLRNHMDRSGGSYLVFKYTGRSLPHQDRPATPPALQRKVTALSGGVRPGSSDAPGQSPRQARNIETVLQSTAKSLYARGEKLGIASAVRNAMDEVHKRAQEIREVQTSTTPVARRRVVDVKVLKDRMTKLEDRNVRLARLLEGAVSELWSCHESFSAVSRVQSDPAMSPDVDRLSLAIAKVQFLQVYLEDPGLPLAEAGLDGQTLGKAPLGDGDAGSAPHQEYDQQDATSVSKDESKEFTRKNAPAAAVETHRDPTGATDQQAQSADEKSAVRQAQPLDNVVEPAQSRQALRLSARPKLEESSLSWMLGQPTSNPSASQGLTSRKQEDAQRRELLFGSEQSRTTSSTHGVVTSPRSGGPKDDFDLGNLRRGKGR